MILRNRGGERYLGFSVVEIMVVLGIMAVLMLVGSFAINEAQRATRAQDRVNKAGEISGAINDYLRERGNLPSETTGTITWEATLVRVGNDAIELTGFLRFEDSDSDTTHTNYRYVREFGQYQVCVQQENGTWEGVGSGNNFCP
jgi:type II secretory pathway pseudopilin PulG